jgi:hypothetical protein
VTIAFEPSLGATKTSFVVINAHRDDGEPEPDFEHRVQRPYATEHRIPLVAAPNARANLVRANLQPLIPFSGGIDKQQSDIMPYIAGTSIVFKFKLFSFLKLIVSETMPVE